LCSRRKGHHPQQRGARKTLPHVLATNLWFRNGDRASNLNRRKIFTQGFFALLLERQDLNTVRQEKGRLRSYLLTSLRHFLTNERNRAMAIKRGEGQRLIPLEDLREREHARL
jgi:RNA polymerase sigma-70 factor (ECF subfamily)